jgi:hypothetical protein
MRKTKFKANSIVLIVIGILCLAILVVSARPRKNQTTTDGVAAKKPLLILKDQPNSPLTITSVIVDEFSDPRMPTVNFNVINNSGKPIMVYAIKHEAALGSRGTVSGWVAVNSPDSKHALRPGRAPQGEISGIQYPEPPESLTLSVDFVEFVDGTRWGDDTFKNGERIDGVRAGANEEREALMKVLRTNGTEELIRSLDSIEPKADQPSSRSAQWLDGYRHGVGWMRERVRSKGQSHSEIEKELRRPVNSTEDRR